MVVTGAGPTERRWRHRPAGFVLTAGVVLAVLLTATVLRSDRDAPIQHGPNRPCEPGPGPVEARDRERSASVTVIAERSAVGEATDVLSIDERSVLVASRDGMIRRVDLDTGAAQSVIDLTATTEADVDGGLLAMTFDPRHRWLYVLRTTADDRSELTAHELADHAATAFGPTRIIIEAPQPELRHNGGMLLFGPDDLLYLSFGDGGTSLDDLRHSRRPDTLLGTLLRLRPTPDGPAPYETAAGRTGFGPGARPEVAAIGLRNPYRAAFDGTRLVIADVGGKCREEIDQVTLAELPGADFGWSLFEGTRPFRGEDTGDTVVPSFEYEHVPGWCAVVGGPVLGPDAPVDLRGHYLFGDHCAGRVLAVDLSAPNPTPVELGIEINSLTGFRSSGDGRLYATSLSEGLVQIEL